MSDKRRHGVTECFKITTQDELRSAIALGFQVFTPHDRENELAEAFKEDQECGGDREVSDE